MKKLETVKSIIDALPSEADIRSEIEFHRHRVKELKKLLKLKVAWKNDKPQNLDGTPPEG